MGADGWNFVKRLAERAKSQTLSPMFAEWTKTPAVSTPDYSALMGAAGRVALEASAMGTRLRRSIVPRGGKARAADSKRRLFETSARSKLLGYLQQSGMARRSCTMRNLARRTADWSASDRASVAGRCRAGGEPPIGSRDGWVAEAAAVKPNQVRLKFQKAHAEQETDLRERCRCLRGRLVGHSEIEHGER